MNFKKCYLVHIPKQKSHSYLAVTFLEIFHFNIGLLMNHLDIINDRLVVHHPKKR